MVRVAIVEDEPDSAKILHSYLQKYEKESGQNFSVTHFTDGDEIISNYSGDYDIILMDIMMQFVDGMSAAEEIRRMDSRVIIIFITNMTQYAVRGYEVDALDYILKPVEYFSFSKKLGKALRKLEDKKEKYLRIQTREGVLRLPVSDILYIESEGNDLVFHMRTESITTRKTMKELEVIVKKLYEGERKENFFRINKGVMVNMSHVEAMRDGCLLIGGDMIPVSRSRRKGFLESFLKNMDPES